MIDATAHRVVAKDRVTLYTEDADGMRRHFTVDEATATAVQVGEFWATGADCEVAS